MDELEFQTQIDDDDTSSSVSLSSAKRKKTEPEPTERSQRHNEKMSFLRQLVEPTAEKASALDLFFSSVARTVATFPKTKIAQIKSQVMTIITDAEIENEVENSRENFIEYIID